MRRPALALVLVLALAACGGATTAAAVADPAPKGIEVDRTVSDVKEVLDFQVPPGIDTGLQDAVHKIGKPVTYTVYHYDTPESAKAALALWGKGVVGSAAPFQDVLLSLPGPDKLGEGALELSLPGENTYHSVGRAGPFVVVTIGQEQEAAKDTAIELYGRLPK